MIIIGKFFKKFSFKSTYNMRSKGIHFVKKREHVQIEWEDGFFFQSEGRTSNKYDQ